MKLRESYITTMAATDTTIGSATLMGVHAVGSAADSTLTILDGTAIKLQITIATTAETNRAYSPLGFNNLKTDLTGTGSYSLIVRARP